MTVIRLNRIDKELLPFIKTEKCWLKSKGKTYRVESMLFMRGLYFVYMGLGTGNKGEYRFTIEDAEDIILEFIR